MTFQDQSAFPGLSRSWNFQKKIQDFPGGMGTLAFSRPNKYRSIKTDNFLYNAVLGQTV